MVALRSCKKYYLVVLFLPKPVKGATWLRFLRPKPQKAVIWLRHFCSKPEMGFCLAK